MSWIDLPTNFKNLVWSGLKKYRQYDNVDGTVSFEDVTEYEDTDNTQMGAAVLNQMTGGINELMARTTFEASAFSEEDSYSIGDKVIYENELYKFISAHAAGEWDPTEVEVVTYPDSGDLGGMAFEDDAPEDEKTYGRRDGDWAEIPDPDWENIGNKPETFPPSPHNHDDRYYTEGEVDEKLADKADMIVTSADGSIAHIEDGGAYPVKDLKVSIEPMQDLHGYANPWPAGGGKNLCNAVAENVLTYSNYTNYTISNGVVTITGNALAGFIVPVTPSTQYTASWTKSNTDSVSMRIREYSSMPTSFEGSAYIDQIVNGMVSTASFTTAENATYILFTFYRGGAPTSTLTLSNLQVELGDSKTDFAPYSNICPISGHSSAVVTRTGKNWCDAVDEKTIVPYNDYSDFTINNGVVSITGPTLMGFIIPVKPNTQYTGSLLKSASDTMQFRIREYSAKPTAFSDSAYIDQPINKGNSTTGKEQFSFTTTANTKYILYVIYKGTVATEGITISDIQLELGASATSFEPYHGETIIIDLEGTRYRGNLDVLTGVLTIDGEFITLTSNMTWNSEQTLSDINRYFRTKISDRGHHVDRDIICSHFKQADIVSNNSVTGVNILNSSAFGGDIIYVRPNNLTDFPNTDTFKTWLDAQATANTPVQCVVKLVTPLTIQCDPETISLLLGLNNIFADTGDVSVEYKADTKLFIEGLTKPTEDDMVANTNIASGKFFTIGNNLYFSTASIATGEKIVPGTNCNSLSIADALNNLNS